MTGVPSKEQARCFCVRWSN